MTRVFSRAWMFILKILHDVLFDLQWKSDCLPRQPSRFPAHFSPKVLIRFVGLTPAFKNKAIARNLLACDKCGLFPFV